MQPFSVIYVFLLQHERVKEEKIADRTDGKDKITKKIKIKKIIAGKNCSNPGACMNHLTPWL
jgi:hypothetical protein